ncbi:MAG: glucosaminidase domain-containing protein [Prevotella sp.]|nr:glucosaminidase domain-containing protein [Prevotella sp.]
MRMMTVRNRQLLVLLTLLATMVLNASAQTSQRYKQYIERYRDIAIEQMLKWKVPASITLAQGLLESAAGQSTLATEGNNHFGIKCHGWTGRTVYRDDDRKNECFRAYSSAYESFEDHSRFLAKGQRYRKLFSLKITDYKGWARGLKAAGYATNPQYAQSLINIIESNGLSQYDKAKNYDKFLVERSHDGNVNGQPLHPIYVFNKNYYLYARQGDTFKTLAEEIGISYRKLARYNERDKRDRLEPGEIVWLKKKQKKAPKEFKGLPHTVAAGESMYTIAQKYGIRLQSLYKLNRLTPDYSIQVGDVLRLR